MQGVGGGKFEPRVPRERAGASANLWRHRKPDDMFPYKLSEIGEAGRRVGGRQLTASYASVDQRGELDFQPVADKYRAFGFDNPIQNGFRRDFGKQQRNDDICVKITTHGSSSRICRISVTASAPKSPRRCRLTLSLSRNFDVIRRGSDGAGAIIATGFPCRVMVTGSPASASSTRRANWSLACANEYRAKRTSLWLLIAIFSFARTNGGRAASGRGPPVEAARPTLP